jgi:hypothetical protein
MGLLLVRSEDVRSAENFLVDAIFRAFHYLRIAHFQLTELPSADGSAGAQAKHEARQGKQQKHHSIHQPSPLW